MLSYLVSIFWNHPPPPHKKEKEHFYLLYGQISCGSMLCNTFHRKKATKQTRCALSRSDSYIFLFNLLQAFPHSYSKISSVNIALLPQLRSKILILKKILSQDLTILCLPNILNFHISFSLPAVILAGADRNIAHYQHWK